MITEHLTNSNTQMITGINMMWFETYPCQHYVTFINEKTELLDGKEILELLYIGYNYRFANIKPHFNIYR